MYKLGLAALVVQPDIAIITIYYITICILVCLGHSFTPKAVSVKSIKAVGGVWGSRAGFV